MREIRLGLVQLEPKLKSPEDNLLKIRSYAEKAAAEQVDILVFPELALTGYMCGDYFYSSAEPIDGPSFQTMAKIARDTKLHIIYGAPELVHHNTVYNVGIMIDDTGKRIGYHRKNYLPNHSVFDERRWFRPGNTLNAFDTKFGRIGILICYDIFFPEVSRALALDGAEVMICISASPSMRKDLFETLTRARAIENSSFFIYVNLTGPQEEVVFWGGSHVVNPAGKVITRAGYDEEKLVISTIDLDEINQIAPFTPTLKDLRKDSAITVLQKLKEFEGI